MSGRGDCRQRRDQQNDHLDSARTERKRPGNGDEGACCQTTRPRCAVQGQASPQGLSRQESRPCPPRQQNGQDRRSAETAGGVTLQELTKATGWQPHSVRGFLSGTIGRKMGTPVESFKSGDGERAYRIASK